MNRVEQLAQKRLTREFINSDAISVSLSRPVMVDSGAGGVMPGSVTILDAQSFRLVPASSSVFQSIRNKLEGTIPQEDYLLIGNSNADIEIKDTFEVSGGLYEVISISTDRTYRIAAGVVYRGLVA